MEGEKSIYKGFDTMWKLNPSDRTIAFAMIVNQTWKFTHKGD